MRLIVAGVLALMLGLFGPVAIQVAGDEGPGSGAVPPVQLFAGDEGPGSG